MLRLINDGLIRKGITSQILAVSLLYTFTTAAFCRGTRSSYENNVNERTGTSSEETEGMNDANEENNTGNLSETPNNESSPLAVTHERGAQGESNIVAKFIEVNKDKVEKEQRDANEKKANEDKKNEENNRKPVVKMVGLDTFATIGNPELNDGSWINYSAWNIEANKYRESALNLYKVCGISSKGTYLKDVFDPAKNHISDILAEIKAYEAKGAPSIHETRSYLRRLTQLAEILSIKDAYGSRKYVKNGTPKSISEADAKILEEGISKSIAAKAGMHPLYDNHEEKVTAQNIRKTYDSRLKILHQFLETGVAVKGQPWNKELVREQIKVIELIQAGDEASLRPYLAMTADRYTECRKLLKRYGEMGYDANPSVDLLKLVTLSFVNIESNGALLLEIF